MVIHAKGRKASVFMRLNSLRGSGSDRSVPDAPAGEDRGMSTAELRRLEHRCSCTGFESMSGGISSIGDDESEKMQHAGAGAAPSEIVASLQAGGSLDRKSGG